MKYEHCPNIPRLAWLYCQASHAEPLVRHGSGVEVFSDGLFEGCFAGPPTPSGLLAAHHVFGSGVCWAGRECWFIPPSHTLESLFVYIHKRGYSVSNSLPFLVEHHGLSLPFDYSIARRFASIMHGIQEYGVHLFSLPGGELLRVAFDKFRVSEGGQVIRIPKDDDIQFVDFEGYKQELLRILKAAFENGADARRKQALLPVATCSSGYDSSAGAALARSLGCTQALTLTTARGGQNDSGTPIGQALGLEVVEVQSHSIVRDGIPLYEMFATGMGADDYATTLFESQLPNKIMLTGWYGDRIWGLNGPICSRLERGDISGCSLQEFRLRVGFTQIHVPIIAFRHLPKIVEIGKSAEMAKYRIGGTYDRPIPRRLLEEAGVPRMAFGQSKKAAAILLLWDAADIPPEARTAFNDTFSKIRPGIMNRCVFLIRSMVWQAEVMLMRLIRKGFSVLGRKNAFPRQWSDLLTNRPLAGLALLAGVEKTRSLYR